MESNELKYGFTTGSAACASAKAALNYLITGIKSDVSIETPSGIIYTPKVYDYFIERLSPETINIGDYAGCYVIKESGDDPDITAGMKIFSKVTINGDNEIIITGAKGIGRVTRKGLDQNIGEYAINSVPRKMIKDALTKLLYEHCINMGVTVEISAPEGEEVAKKTFNPHMGIEGGISIIGTSGIVRPMSTEALIDTIKLDINIKYNEGMKKCIIAPGNYGVTFLKNNYGIEEKDIVLCSNFVSDAMKLAVDRGFTKILFCSHIGKMIKVSGGVLNTHSMYGDRRMEFMSDALSEAVTDNDNVDIDFLKEKIKNCISTTEALNVIEPYGLIKRVSKVIVDKTKNRLEEVCNNKATVDVILYENSYGELAKSF